MNWITWLEGHALTCSFKEVSGIDCLGCGLQRSALSLLKGDLHGSVRFYPPLLFLISYVLLILTYILPFQLISTETIRRGAYALLAIVVLSYIYKAIFFGLTN